jgi:hypothetical protein
MLSIGPVSSQEYIIIAVFNEINPEQELPAYYSIDYDWHEQELDMSCGPACLKMVFDRYSWNINESEIRRVANTDPDYGSGIHDLLRAAHFSNDSTSIQTPTIHGYTGKWFGTDAIDRHFPYATEEEQAASIETLKRLIVQEKSIILVMWDALEQTIGHGRVLCGYNDIFERFYFSDPYDGPFWSASYDELYIGYWNILDCYAQMISPWRIEVRCEGTPQSGIFSLTAIVDSGIHADNRSTRLDLSDTQITLSMPLSYTLSSDEITKTFSFNSSGLAEITWQIDPPSSISNDDQFYLGVRGTISSECPSYSTYQDTIYCEKEVYVVDWVPPSLQIINGTVLNDSKVQVSAYLLDEHKIQSVELLWKRTATDWTRHLMAESEGLWTCPENITLPELNSTRSTQIRILAQDIYGNKMESPVFEMQSLNVTRTDTGTHSESDLFPLQIGLIGMGSAVFIVIVLLLVKRRKYQ